jgi:hypothetical protein
MKQSKLAVLVVFGLSILFCTFFDYCKHAPALGTANPYGLDPYDAVGSFGIQLALLAALMTLLREFRPYPRNVVPPAQLLLILRGGTVVLLAVTITLTTDAIGLARSIVTGGGSPAAWTLAGLLGWMAFGTLVASWIFARAARGAEVPIAQRPWRRAVIVSGLSILILAFYPLEWRDSGIPGGIFTALAGMVLLFVTVWGLATAIFPAMEFMYVDIFSDISAIFQALLRHFGRTADLPLWMERLTTLPPLRRLLDWLNPRRRPWNMVILTAVATGLLLVTLEVFAERISPNLGRMLLVVGVYVGLEGTGVALGYILFGKYLGIFQAK